MQSDLHFFAKIFAYVKKSSTFATDFVIFWHNLYAENVIFWLFLYLKM